MTINRMMSMSKDTINVSQNAIIFQVGVVDSDILLFYIIRLNSICRAEARTIRKVQKFRPRSRWGEGDSPAEIPGSGISSHFWPVENFVILGFWERCSCCCLRPHSFFGEIITSKVKIRYQQSSSGYNVPGLVSFNDGSCVFPRSGLSDTSHCFVVIR